VSQWLSAETQRLSCFTNPPDSPAVTSRSWPLIGLIVKSYWLQSARAAGMNEVCCAPMSYNVPKCMHYTVERIWGKQAAEHNSYCGQNEQRISISNQQDQLEIRMLTCNSNSLSGD